GFIAPSFDVDAYLSLICSMVRHTASAVSSASRASGYGEVLMGVAEHRRSAPLGETTTGRRSGGSLASRRRAQSDLSPNCVPRFFFAGGEKSVVQQTPA